MSSLAKTSPIILCYCFWKKVYGQHTYDHYDLHFYGFGFSLTLSAIFIHSPYLKTSEDIRIAWKGNEDKPYMVTHTTGATCLKTPGSMQSTKSFKLDVVSVMSTSAKLFLHKLFSLFHVWCYQLTIYLPRYHIQKDFKF